MDSVPLLWNSTARKESFDLLAHLWATMDDAGRERLASSILSGPPKFLLDKLAPEDRDSSRDRRVFDRIWVIKRSSGPQLSESLRLELERIQLAYPVWRPQDAESAHFSSWMSSGAGEQFEFDLDALRGMNDDELVRLLFGPTDRPDDLHELWRQFSAVEPDRSLAVLQRMIQEKRDAAVGIWRAGVWGLRDHAKMDPLRKRILELLISAPREIQQEFDFIRGLAEVLEAASRRLSDESGVIFWQAFDKVQQAVVADPENAETPTSDSWVSLAINRSLGHLTSAILNALFSRSLKVGDGLPKDISARLDLLVTPTDRSKLLASVIAASRLSYLFAVDPDWTRRQLLPSFSWQDEVRSVAVWQGYAWQARIDRQLWAELKPHFLELFSAERLLQLRHFSRSAAQLFAVIGVEYGAAELPRDKARDAVRAMTAEMRVDCIAWVVGYLETEQSEDDGDQVTADDLWVRRVAPWLGRVWPADPELHAPDLSAQFGLAVIATNREFDRALEVVRPYVGKTFGYILLHGLKESSRPEDNPRAVIRMIDTFLQEEWLHAADDLASVLKRLADADTTISSDPIFRRWNEYVRVRS